MGNVALVVRDEEVWNDLEAWSVAWGSLMRVDFGDLIDKILVNLFAIARSISPCDGDSKEDLSQTSRTAIHPPGKPQNKPPSAGKRSAVDSAVSRHEL